MRIVQKKYNQGEKLKKEELLWKKTLKLDTKISYTTYLDNTEMYYHIKEATEKIKKSERLPMIIIFLLLWLVIVPIGFTFIIDGPFLGLFLVALFIIIFDNFIASEPVMKKFIVTFTRKKFKKLDDKLELLEQKKLEIQKELEEL